MDEGSTVTALAVASIAKDLSWFVKRQEDVNIDLTTTVVQLASYCEALDIKIKQLEEKIDEQS
jgi:hypothetical protein